MSFTFWNNHNLVAIELLEQPKNYLGTFLIKYQFCYTQFVI